MFFVGIFGIQPGRKQIGEGTGVCPSCGAYDRYEIDETYNYFHIFFIPVWKWNKRYFLRTRCCRRRLELDPDVGRRIAQGERIQIRSEHIISPQDEHDVSVCQSCGSLLRPEYRFCPRCGTQR